MYGTAWLNIFGKDGESYRKDYAEMRETWFKALKNLYPRDLARGLAEALKSGKAFAPGLSEFFAMCKPSFQSQMYKDFKALPKPKSNHELGMKNLGKLKEILKK